MDKGKIYKITNTINGEVYVGCTVTTLKKRYHEHLYRCFKSDYKSKLYNSIKKYGEENFTIELITECNVDKIYETEKLYIKQYNSFEDGLNSTLGGEGCLGYTHSSEIRKKISKAVIDGNSHKGKTYDKLYGENSDTEKERRKESVKKHWDSLTNEERIERKEKIKEANRNKSTHSVEFIKELKTKLKNGIKIKELSQQYPNIRKSFFYDLKNGRRWSDI
jgi:group I intron endonuclease